MKKLLTALTVLTVLMLATMASAETLMVGTEGAYPPFNGVNADGELEGFDIDIANALCEEMGMECEFVVQDWDGLIPALQAKKFDCIIASMSITEERLEVVDFTDKYYTSPAQFVAAEGAGIEITKEGLEGKTIGVQISTVSENYVRDNFSDVAEIKSYETIEQANMDLVAGRLDLVFADKLVLLGGFIETPEGEGYEFTGPEFSQAEWFGPGIGIALRKGEDDLLAKLNAAIAAIREKGIYQQINDKYFPFDVYGE